MKTLEHVYQQKLHPPPPPPKPAYVAMTNTTVNHQNNNNFAAVIQQVIVEQEGRSAVHNGIIDTPHVEEPTDVPYGYVDEDDVHIRYENGEEIMVEDQI